VFRDFFTCGLRFPCDPLLPAILDKISVKIHQLSPNLFLEVSKFLWIMKTFGCNFSVDVFGRLFELVIMSDVIKLNDGQYYEAHSPAALSTPAGWIQKKDSRESRLHLATRATS
jgi:hypothetical protein